MEAFWRSLLVGIGTGGGCRYNALIGVDFGDILSDSWTHVELSCLTNLAALGPLMVPLDEGGCCAPRTLLFTAFGARVWKLSAVR